VRAVGLMPIDPRLIADERAWRSFEVTTALTSNILYSTPEISVVCRERPGGFNWLEF